MPSERRKYVLFGVLGAIVFVLDQWTKVLAREHLRPLGPGRSVTVIDGFFNLRYSENTGVAFGMFQTMPGGRVILTVLALAAFVLVIYYLHRTPPDLTRLHIALGLIGGGAVGNLTDRLLHGRVTDFVVWYFRSFEWPAFNIADAALVVGVALLAVDIFRPERREAPREPAKT